MLAVPTRPAALLAVAATAFITPQMLCAQAPLAAPSSAGTPPVSAPSTTPAPPPAEELDPASPMAPLPDLGVEWPTVAPADAPAPGQPVATPGDDLRRYRIELVGIDALSEFRIRFDALSSLRAGAAKPANAAQINRRTSDDEDLAKEILRSIGRYDATVTSSVSAPAGGETVVKLTIDPGPVYAFTGVDLPGLDAGGAKAKALGSEFAVKRGDTVDADRVNAAVNAFQLSLRNQSYPFATVAEPAVTIDHGTHEASLSVPVTLGAPARFGKIVVTGTRPVFSAHHVTDMARFHPGEPYEVGRLDDLRRALIATSLISTADIKPVQTVDPGVVDISVHLERAPPRTIAGELGYGTGEGARAEVSWQHRNLIKPEGAVTFRGVAGTQEQSLSALLRQNNFHARDLTLTSQIAAAHTNFNAYDARTFTISGGFERQSNIIYQKKWTWSGGGEFVVTDDRDTIIATGQPRRRTFLVAALPGSIGYDCSDDLLNPTRCFRLTLHVSPEVSLQNGAEVYVKSQLDGSAYYPLFGHTVLAGRFRFGSIAGAPRDSIAPSRRFYAGGGGSVRGYSYQKIGPTDVNGDPVGGRGLTELSVEARIRFGNFGVVPFLDAGNLYESSTPKFSKLRYGTGLGFRYYTSFGPIRFDVGTPLKRQPGESRVGVYISLGQAF